jgi:hypothetical protein
MVKQWLLIAFIGLLFSCKNKKISLADDEDLNVHEFVGYFQPIKLPCQFSDTSLVRHPGDSVEIGHQTFLRFIPDSVLSRQFGKMGRPKLFPIGKAGNRKAETYIFIKALSSAKKVLYVLCFDKDDKFSASKALVISDADSRGNWIAGMDAKYTISIQRQHQVQGQLLYKKEVYVYNDAGIFTLILTESNEPKPQSSLVYNPIDTLPRKHRFSGDYVQDKRNFISFRDGKDNVRMQFFVHFEKEEGSCKGELKGEARLISANTARYKSTKDPCMIEFYFSNNWVRMKELEGCGIHRDIKCYFEGAYEKKKEVKHKPVRKKNSNSA